MIGWQTEQTQVEQNLSPNSKEEPYATGSVEQSQLSADPDGAGLMLIRAQGILTFHPEGW